MAVPTDPEVVRQVAARLEAAGVPNAGVDARLLVEHVVETFGGAAGCHGAVLDGLVARRSARVPLQQVIGRTWFRTLELRCAPGVFVPRPETEIVAGVAIDAAHQAGSDLAAGRDRVRVVDVGTGTGAIALSVATEVDGVEVVAVERDPVAVAQARANAGRVVSGAAGPSGFAPGASVEVLEGTLLDPVPATWRGELDVLVSNPPYLPASDRGSWEPEVGDHDPDTALVGGPDGHEVVDELLHLAANWLRPGGTVVVEIDDRRGADALAAARAAGLVDAHLVQDLTRRDRAVVAHRRR
jgi:release factor glutamine methyltransferase